MTDPQASMISPFFATASTSPGTTLSQSCTSVPLNSASSTNTFPPVSVPPTTETSSPSDPHKSRSLSSSSTSNCSPHLSPLPIPQCLPKYACQVPDCPERFTYQRQFVNHMRGHVRKVFTCSFGACTKSYPHAKSLREHKQTRHQGKRYLCDIPGCNETVAQKKNLRRHKESEHGNDATLTAL